MKPPPNPATSSKSRPAATPDPCWVVSEQDADRRLGAFLRPRLADLSWGEIKRLISRGKILVDGQCLTGPTALLQVGQNVVLRRNAPRLTGPSEIEGLAPLYEDAAVVVVDKPTGLSSVPFEPDDTDTAMHRLWQFWREQGRGRLRQPLLVVHRIDKGTSGLLLFARNKRAAQALSMQFRVHDVQRRYICVAHGVVRPGRIASYLVADRGDGLRGSGTARLASPHQAVTHVKVLRSLVGASLCEVRLETGKTHQIRIHLSEQGHPLVGETVYDRDFVRRGQPLVDSPRLLLHAAELGFVHPQTGARLHFTSPLPDDFLAVLARLEPAAAR